MGQLGRESKYMNVRKFLALLGAMGMMALVSGVAQTSKDAENNDAYINKAKVAKAAEKIGAKAAFTTSGANAGIIPMWTDTAGDMANSTLFQSGRYVGIGTTAPGTILDVDGVSDTISYVVSRLSGNASGYGAYLQFTDGVTYNYAAGTATNGDFTFTAGRFPNSAGTERMRLTQAGNLGIGTAAPLSTLHAIGAGGFGAENSNGTSQASKVPIVAQSDSTAIGILNAESRQVFALNIDSDGGSSGSRGVVDFYDKTNGTWNQDITLNSGKVGIGTTTPAYPLTVNGVIQSIAGGFRFPDGTTQTTAATGGGGLVAITSPDSSITVGGTSSAPTLAVNTANIQKRVSGTCAAGSVITAVNADGTVICGSVGPGGTLASVPVVVANTTITGNYGAGTPQTIYTATASGFYRVSVYMNSPSYGSCSSAPCAGETLTIQWSDGISTTALATANCSLVAPCGSSFSTPIWVQSGQAITAYGQSWGSGNAPTAGTYNAYVLVEQL